MKLTLLGTGGADWPRDTAHLGDEKGLDRRNTSLLVDDDLLIDPNSDVPEALETFGCDKDKITTILISHSHGDHFSAETIEYICRDHHVDVYGAAGYKTRLPKCKNYTFHVVAPMQKFAFRATSCRALFSTHIVDETDESCLIYTIERNGKKLFYATDGAWFTAETWQGIGGRCDAVVFDATFGDDEKKFRIPHKGIFFYHNNLSMLLTLRDIMAESGKIDSKTALIADHLSKAYYPNIETAHAVFDSEGFIASYDGLVIEV